MEYYSGIYKGATYIGEFSKGKIHGKGMLKLFKGSRYEGDFRNKKVHG